MQKVDYRWTYAVEVTPQTEKAIVEGFFRELPQPHGIFSRDIERINNDECLWILTEHYVDSGSVDYLYTKKRYS